MAQSGHEKGRSHARTDYGRSLALIFRGVRYARRKSQEELAETLEISVPSVKQIERGQRKERLNYELSETLATEGVPAALFAETTEPDRQRVRDVLAYLRYLKVPSQKIDEWTSLLDVAPVNDSSILYRVDVSLMSREEDLLSRVSAPPG